MTDRDEPVSAADRWTLSSPSRLLMARFDREDRLVQATAAFQLLFGVTASERPSWAELLRAGHAQGRGLLVEANDVEAWIVAACRRRRAQDWQAYAAELCDGRRLWITEELQDDGELLLLACDITALPAGQRQSRARPDALTGLTGRMPLLRQLQQTLVRSEAWPLCVVALEIDGFAGLDDAGAGSPAEAVLRDLGRSLQASVRREDGCGRTGAANFLLVLPTAGRGQAGAIAERLLARARLAEPRQGLAYTCSAGLVEACWGEAATDLLARAEAACRTASQAGGDRLVDGG